MSAETVLKVTDLTKSFHGQVALNRVSLEVMAGEVTALIGHNGSGKSTMIKILAGFHVPDHHESTRVTVGDQDLRFGHPDESRKLGLRFIHQDLGLVPSLSVLENLQLGRPWDTGFGWRIRMRREKERARAALAMVGLDVDLEAETERLGPIQRTQLAVARALTDDADARVVVLDEPTAVLPANEVETLFSLVRRLKSHGVGIIYVSHRLEEVAALADHVAVLRDGRLVGSGPASEFPKDRLVGLVVGEDHVVAPADRSAAERLERGEPCLTFEGVRVGQLVNAEFTVHAGEVLGVAGLTGSGVDDIVPALQGRLEIEAGRIGAGPELLPCTGPQRLLRHEIATLPVERDLRSLATLTVRENLSLPDIRAFWRGWALSLGREAAEARELVKMFNIRPGRTEAELRELSGGNQQKVNLAKWLRRKPEVLVLAEPTQGVDVGGKEEVLGFVREAAEQGMAVLICSSDVYELESVCSRVVVIRRGKVAAELSGADVNATRISRECYGLQAAA